jgi:hypothetical protein
VSKISAGDYTAMSVFDYDYSPGSGEDLVPAVVAALPAPASTQRFSAQITSAAIGVGEPAGGVAQVPAAALQAVNPDAAPQVAEITLSLGPSDQGRRFRVSVSSGDGAKSEEMGGITIFSHHVHGPTTFTVPLPENLGAGRAGGNVPLRFTVVPLEQEGRASATAEARKAVRAARMGTAAPRVSAIDVRTN